jgi:metal-responsive CopG/Arc/MetJ family transcriptional regulator
MEAAVVEKLDEAWKRHGLHSRMELFRKSLHDYLAGVGENEVAALLTDVASGKQ